MIAVLHIFGVGGLMLQLSAEAEPDKIGIIVLEVKCSKSENNLFKFKIDYHPLYSFILSGKIHPYVKWLSVYQILI